MNRAKISAHIISALFPAAGIYLCWWLSEAVGELIAGIAFVILCVNYFWIMRKFKNLQNNPGVLGFSVSDGLFHPC